MKDKNILKFQVFYFLLIGAVGCFTPYINVYLEQSIGLNGSQIGLITAISLILGVCVIPLWGIIGDKTRKYNLMLMISLAASIVVLYFYSKQTVYIGVIVFALMLEVARLGSTPMADTITMNYTAKIGGNYGSIRGMGSLGYMLGDPKEEEKEKPQKGNFKELLTNKNFIFILVLIMITQIVVDSSGAYAGNHLISTLKGDNSLISWLTFVQVLPEFLFLMVASQIIKRLGYKKFFTIATALMAIRLFVYAFIPNSYVFVLISIVHCLGVACSTVASLAYIREVVNPAVFGTAITLLNAAMSIAKAIYGYIFGSIYQYFGSYKIFLISAIIVVVALVIIVTTKRFDNIKKNEV